MPTPFSDSEPARERVEYSFLTPEEIAFRRQVRRALWALLVLTIIGSACWFGMYPTVHAVKGWQARRIAGQALEAIDQGKWKEAREKVQDAHILRPNEPEVIRATAIFLTRTGAGREAVSHWKVFESHGRLTTNDERDFTTASLLTGDLPLAQEHLATAWPEGQPGTPADWWLGLQVATRLRQADVVTRLAHQLIESFASSERQHYGSAQILLSLDVESETAFGWKTIESIARGGHSAESLDALLLLARRSAGVLTQVSSAEGASQASAVPIVPIDELIPLIEHHPLAKAPHILLTYDLRLLKKPDQRALLFKDAENRFSGSKDLDDVAALASWFYGKGEYAKVREILPLSRALGSRALFLQYLDTLGAAGEWQAIKDLIEGQRFPLDPMFQQMYLARCTQKLGQPESSRVHWTSAIEAAKGNAEKLASIGQYAERTGESEFAEIAYCGAFAVAPQSHPVCEVLLHVYERLGKTRKMAEFLQKMAAAWPTDDAIFNDLVYINLLLGDTDPKNLESARTLARANPSNLTYRVTLALAEYRQGHALSALEAFSGVGAFAPNTPTRFLAIYAVVLFATDYSKEARQIADKIRVEELLPEEKEMIRPIFGS